MSSPPGNELRPRVPWPAAPRPFVDEPFGGWLGRVAARYRMPVTQLWDNSGMARPAESLGPIWLLWADVGEVNLERLSWLSRVDARQLAELVPSAATFRTGARLPYCFKCLFYNEADVTSPCWKRAWLEVEAPACTAHNASGTVSASTVGYKKNFAHLLDLISGLHRLPGSGSGRYRYSQK
jgi:hypothetical protein